jgi:hypothetical protein
MLSEDETMFAYRKLQLAIALFASANWAGLATAQAPLYTPRPVSNSGGSAGSELGTIYRQDVGTGYSAAGQNSLSLSGLRGTAPYSGYISPPRTAPSGGARIGLGVGASQAPKPFTGYDPGPTVSPYLNLFREDFEGNDDFNYTTLVRPQLQQQQFNQQVQRQNMELARRLQSMAAQSDFNPEGSKSQYPTGHQTVFGYYGHYYPSMNARRR